METRSAEIDNNELSELQGEQFNKKWCQALADRHERFIRLFERRSDKTDGMELKSWIDTTLTIACGKREGLWVIEVCSSLFIFISLDRAQVLIARQQ